MVILLIFLLLLHILPGYFLYVSIYGIFHSNAVWEQPTNWQRYQSYSVTSQNALSHSFLYFLIAVAIMAVFSNILSKYFANRNQKKGEKYTPPTLRIRFIAFLIEFGISLAFVMPIAWGNSAINPW